MCGICGQVNSDTGRPVDRQILQRMNDVIRHRGPDSEGFFIRDNVGLAMRRLAIIDLSTGDQPISNEDGSVWIVLNGEIYNFPELRADLESKGHVFRTHSDTETVVHLYEEHGEDCVERLRGMFAFAIWDCARSSLFIARDRLGQKPLYYSESAGSFVFGSEIKCLLQHPSVPREVNPEAIHHYLTLQYVPDPLSAFKSIAKLPAAHSLIWKNGAITTKRYWDLNYEPKWRDDTEELKEELRSIVREAVRMRMISDVPLGAHLSGGIDSSVVVALMAEAQSEPVKTFSIGFEEDAFNETGYARQIAERYGTDHHEFTLRPNAAEVVPRMVEHFDEPFADAAAIPNWYLAEMTRLHVTVALNGDGGDEAFAGYQRYFADPIADIYRCIPSFIRSKFLDRLLSALPVDSEKPAETNRVMALRRLALAAELPHSASVVRWGSYFTEAEKLSMYTPEMAETVGPLATWRILERSFGQAKAAGRLDKTLYTDIHNYLPGALLPKVDRMTMAHSLEARSPFLDHKVMEFAARFPTGAKIKGTTTKALLRKTFSDLMPKELAARGKMGFGVPLGRWFQTSLYGMTKDLLMCRTSKLSEYLTQGTIARLIESNRTGERDNGKKLWALLFLEVWLRGISERSAGTSGGQ